MNLKKLTGLLSASLIAMSVPAGAQTVFGLDAAKRGPAIGPLHYGIFYEEINYGGDGGLYAELVANRSFENNSAKAENWLSSANAEMQIVRSDLNSAQVYGLQANFTEPGAYIANEGFWGIGAVEGTTYTLSFWVKAPAGYSATMQASLTSVAGAQLGSADIALNGNGKWQKYTAQITATGTNAKAQLRLSPDKAGILLFDMVSLFPPTYKNRENGCRIDLAEKLEALKPAFVRFPGGCFVEGTMRDGSRNRFEWKKSIGPIEMRPGHQNVNWGYRVTDGLGMHELLQLSEDLGAEPLFVTNIGLGHGWSQPYDQLEEFIQEALDVIEYCNGDVTTPWGAKRAANGHPEPFNLRLIEIGNENYQANVSEQSDHYAERYIQFYNAIKAKYPDVLVIGNVESWGTDTPSWRNSHPVDAVDEHYYRNPDWFKSMYNKYDGYDRRGPKVYVGEYAVTQNFGTYGNLEAALGEAIYMLGMERNSDMVVMNSYAPIFTNENVRGWMPDMIRFNSARSYGTPSYHVQQLMPNNVGKVNLRYTESGNMATTGHKIGFSTWSTTAQYDNVKVTDLDGNPVFGYDFAETSADWKLSTGWKIENGVLSQTNGSQQGIIVYATPDAPDSFIYEFDATKISGAEGFLVAFNYGSTSNYTWWNIAGWGNTQHAIEHCVNGTKSTLATAAGSIETGRTYHGKIKLDGTHLQCWLDGNLVHDVNLPVERKVYTSATIDDATGTVYFKTVNYGRTSVPVQLDLSNCTLQSAESTILHAGSRTAENTPNMPEYVKPKAGTVTVDGQKISFNAPANSFTIVRAKVTDIQTPVGDSMNPEAVAAAKAELAPLARLLGNLHASATLPSSTASGCSISWNLKPGSQGISVNSGAWASRLDVEPAHRDNAVAAGTLVASLTDASGATGTVELPVTLAASDNMYGYLYCFMNSTKEITNFALGTKEDKGKKYDVILGGREIFDTYKAAGIEHGTRDAYICRGQNPDQYLMATTDMCNATSHVWNNYGLNIHRSADLMHWDSETFDFRRGKSIFSDPEATTDIYKTDAEYSRITRVWAPQIIWDPAAFGGQGAYLVYYSVLSGNSGDNHDRIVYSYADRDFKTLTQPRLFYDPGYSVIDADIVYNEYDKLYHMWIKREGANGAERGIYELTASTLVGAQWTPTNHITNEGSELTEGSSTIRRIDEDVYNVYYMRYSGGSAYKVCETDHEGQHVTSSANLEGTGAFQHGSFMTLTEDEYKMLDLWNTLDARINWAKTITGTDIFNAPIAEAQTAMQQNRSVATLLTAMTAALQQLDLAYQQYVQQVANSANGDITSLIANNDFSAQGGWNGSSPVIRDGVGEFFNTTFDTWQELSGMPAGTYTLTCSGFYRNGGREALDSHNLGTDTILAALYMNNSEQPLMSLYDASAPYTGNPYTYPDDMASANRAFNTDKAYAENNVTVELRNPGTLRIGLRKTTAWGNDWTCFDNFKLHYSSAISGIQSTDADNRPVNVYNAQGVCIRTNADPRTAVKNLPAGIYIVGNRKVAVK